MPAQPACKREQGRVAGGGEPCVAGREVREEARFEAVFPGHRVLGPQRIGGGGDVARDDDDRGVEPAGIPGPRGGDMTREGAT